VNKVNNFNFEDQEVSFADGSKEQVYSVKKRRPGKKRLQDNRGGVLT